MNQTEACDGREQYHIAIHHAVQRLRRLPEQVNTLLGEIVDGNKPGIPSAKLSEAPPEPVMTLAHILEGSAENIHDVVNDVEQLLGELRNRLF